MNIEGRILPDIGFMRAKQIDDSDRYTLIVYPPGAGPLAGAEPGTMIEREVSEAEVRRIDRVAPHLIARPWPIGEPANRHEAGSKGAKRDLKRDLARRRL